MLDSLRIARGDGSFGKRPLQLSRFDLLILDDFALKPLTQSERHDFLEVIEDRHGARSTLMTSQLPTSRWQRNAHDVNEPTVADALLDRLLQNTYKIDLKVESMRKNRPALTQ